MPLSHLHSYPKTFNRWGHIRAFPVNKPLTYNMMFIAFSALALWMSI